MKNRQEEVGQIDILLLPISCYGQAKTQGSYREGGELGRANRVLTNIQRRP